MTASDYIAALEIPHALDGIGPAVLGPTAFRLAALNDRLRGSPQRRIVLALEQKILDPLAMQKNVFKPSADFSSSRAVAQSLVALADAGDPIASAFARPEFFKIATTYGWLYLQYDIAAAAGVTASPVDVDGVEALLRAGKASDIGETFLAHVGNGSLARRILNDARRDPRISGGPLSKLLFDVGMVHPKLAYRYLRSHVAEVRASVPPTQQAYLICSLVANSLWPAASPTELERFLRKAVSVSDAKILAAADKEIEDHWSSRAELERAL